jgi:hypothetical protein
VIWWRRAEDCRATHRNWQEGRVWSAVEMSFPAAIHIYRHICVIPALFVPANDTDHLAW